MIEVEKKGRVAVVTVNNIEKFNAVDSKTLMQLNKVLKSLNDVKVIVLTGAGGNFISGGDLKEMNGLKSGEIDKFVNYGKDVVKTVLDTDKVVIAAIDGYALGAGCEISLACDIVVCSEKAKFGQPEVKLGLIPGFGGSVLLGSVVGKMALELIIRGNVIDADEALRIGLVNHIIKNPLNEAIKIGDEICNNSSFAIGIAKKFMRRGLLSRFNSETKEFVKCFNKDGKEGISAFLEKRKPRF